MTLDDLNNIDFTDLGSAPAAVRYVIILIVAVVIIIGGYYLIISDQNIELETHQTKEKELRKTFETRAKKAANLEAYKQQLAQMKESFGTMLKQLPSKTEVAELLAPLSGSCCFLLLRLWASGCWWRYLKRGNCEGYWL